MTAASRLSQYLLTAGMLLGGMLFALAGQALIAFYFGAGQQTDALFLARDVAELALKVLLPTQAAGIIVPLYIAARTRGGDRDAARTAGAVLGLGALVATPLVLVVVALAGPLVAVLGPGFDDETAALAERLLRIVAAIAFFALVSTLAAALLQARERFGQAMGTQVVGHLLMLVSLPVLVPSIGVEGAAVAMLAGMVAQALAAWVFLLRAGIPPVASPRRAWSEVRGFARSWAGFLPLAGASQLSGAVFRISASTLSSGGYAVVALAWRLYRALLTLLLTPVQYVLLPALARSEAAGRRSAADAELVATLRQVAFLITPLVATFVVLRGETVSLIFERGDFDAQDASRTATVAALLTVAILPGACYLLLEQAAFARRRSGLVVRANLVAEVIQAASFYPLVVLLGAPGIAVGAGLAVVGTVVVYLHGLRPAGLHPRHHTAFAVQLAACTAALVAAAVLTRDAVQAVSDPGAGLQAGVVLLPASLAGCAAYLAAAAALRVREPLVLARTARALLTGGSVRGA